MGQLLTNPTTVSTNYWIDRAVSNILGDFGDNVSVVNKNKNLLKFGRNSSVGNSNLTTLMTLAGSEINETYVSSNLITTISSSSSSDTQTVSVEGHTISGSDLTFVIQSVTLNGQNQVTLTTPLARCTRITNNGSTDLIGSVYAYQNDTTTNGVPDTDNLVHCIIPAGSNQTEKASTSISSSDYWIVTEVYADILDRSTAAKAEIDLEVRRMGGVFKPVLKLSAGSNFSADHKFEPYLVIPKNSDVRLRAISDSAQGRDVSGGIEGLLAIII